MTRIRLLVVDDHAMFRDGLRAVFEHQEDMLLVGEAGDAETAIPLAQQLKPDVILMDLSLPGRGGVDAAREICALLPQTKIIALTMYHDDDMIAAAIQAGVAGYVLKDGRALELLQAIRTVAAGGAAVDPLVAARVLAQYRHLSARQDVLALESLTEREVTVLRYLGEGRSNREIAVFLSLSEQTIKNALSALYQKLGVGNRTEAVIAAMHRGLITRRP